MRGEWEHESGNVFQIDAVDRSAVHRDIGVLRRSDRMNAGCIVGDTRNNSRAQEGAPDGEVGSGLLV